MRWTQPRLNRLFVAGALDGVVYLVGRMGLDALNLKDGSDAWNHAVELSLPAGRGYRHGNLYHLPLSSGDLATIDLRRGRILTRTRFSKNAQPGNLVSAEGAVVMQSAGSVQGFPPTAELEQQIAKTLEQAPDDAAALAARGELRLHRGKTDAGLADLTRSVKLRPILGRNRSRWQPCSRACDSTSPRVAHSPSGSNRKSPIRDSASNTTG